MTEKNIIKTIREVVSAIDSIPPRKRLKQTESWLRERFPTPHPVKVRIEKFKNENICGECFRRNGYVVIRINSIFSIHEQISSLIHEWAHAMTWPNKRLERAGFNEHSDIWGLAYAKVYREWFDMCGFLTSSGLDIKENIVKKFMSDWENK